MRKIQGVVYGCAGCGLTVKQRCSPILGGEGKMYLLGLMATAVDFEMGTLGKGKLPELKEKFLFLVK